MRIPLLVRACQVIAIGYAALSTLRVVSALANHLPNLIYGRWLAPFWLDIVLVLAIIACLRYSTRRGVAGLFACAAPIAIWLLLTALSAESWTAWHWLPDGGPREPDWMPYAYSYQFRYRSYEMLAGACFGAVIKEVFFATVLAMLLFSATSKQYFGFRWRAPFQSVENGTPEDGI